MVPIVTLLLLTLEFEYVSSSFLLVSSLFCLLTILSNLLAYLLSFLLTLEGAPSTFWRATRWASAEAEGTTSSAASARR